MGQVEAFKIVLYRPTIFEINRMFAAGIGSTDGRSNDGRSECRSECRVVVRFGVARLTNDAICVMIRHTRCE